MNLSKSLSSSKIYAEFGHSRDTLYVKCICNIKKEPGTEIVSLKWLTEAELNVEARK